MKLKRKKEIVMNLDVDTQDYKTLFEQEVRYNWHKVCKELMQYQNLLNSCKSKIADLEMQKKKLRKYVEDE